MGKNISFDVAALVLLAILLCSCYARKMTSGISNRIFLIITYISIAATIFDIAAVTLDNAHSANTIALYTAHSGYIVTHYLSAPLHLLFVISLTDTWHKLHKNKGFIVVLLVPFLAVMYAIAANAANQCLFSVENGYARGPWFGLMYVTTLFYIVIDVVYVIHYRRFFSPGKIVAIATVIPVGLVAMLIQMLFPHLLVEMFCGALCLLIISIGVQRPEDYIDSFTQLMKYSAYVDDMKRAYGNRKKVTVIMLNIGNYLSLLQMIGFDAVTGLLQDIAQRIREIDHLMKGEGDLYYLDNGRYRMVYYWKNRDKAEKIAQALNEELKRQTALNGMEISLEPFIVVAKCPEEVENFKMLSFFGTDFHKKYQYTGNVMRADDLYNKQQLDIQKNIDAIIERAIAEQSFQVYYQPIYSVAQRRFMSAEALIRLNDPQHGFISPEALIVAAEQNGTIHQIGAFVFEKVCQFIAGEEFAKLGLDYIEVNLSVSQIMNSNLPEVYLAIMDKYHVSPDKINLEITETAAAHSQKVMTENLDKLTKAGISFSLDDYGTGYSNIKRVIQLPLKIIKLDKSFADERNNPKMWIFLSNTVKMLKDMNMEIVVEGVETEEMASAFSDMNCDFIQGYFFSKPIPQNDFVEFIKKNANIA